MERPEKLRLTEENKQKTTEGLTLFDLPQELLLKAAFKLDKKAIGRWSQADWTSHDLLKDTKLWQFLIERDFAIKIQEEELPKDITFKRCYQWLSEFERLAQPQINLLDKISKMHRSFTQIFDRPSKEGNKLAMDNIRVLINEINREDIKEEILKAIKLGIHSRDRNIFKPIFVREFAKLLEVYASLYQQGNIVAGFEQVKLYVDLYTDEEKKKWPVMELNSSVVYEIALELIDKYKFRELQLQQYIDQILDATETKEDKFKKTFMLRENIVKQLVEDYGQKKISLDNILRFSPQELRLLQKVFLPMLITKCSEETEKELYENLFKAVHAEVDENYKALDSNIVQDITRLQLTQLFDKLLVSIESESSDSEGEDFQEDSDDETRADDQLGM